MSKPTAAPDPIKLMMNMGKVFEASQKIFIEYLVSKSRDTSYQVLDPVVVTRTFQEGVARALANPQSAIEQSTKFWNDYWRLYAQSVERMWGAQPPATPAGANVEQLGSSETDDHQRRLLDALGKVLEQLQ